MEVTLGGNRLGAGGKQKIEMHNYMMSSFNLSQDFKSTMAPGVLYPFLKMIGTNHGTFDIDLDHFIRTLPTNGPLFGSFKFQADIFCVPFRLYQGILHNNTIKIGLNMNQVYLPKIEIETEDGTQVSRVKGSNKYNRQISDSSLLKYLGLSGLYTATGSTGYPVSQQTIKRKFNAIPVLAYYDIFKCYYANKQEDEAYVIMPNDFSYVDTGTAKQYAQGTSWGGSEVYQPQETVVITKQMAIDNNATIYLKYEYDNIVDPKNRIKLRMTFGPSTNYYENTINNWALENTYCTIEEETDKHIIISINTEQLKVLYEDWAESTDTINTVIIGEILTNPYETTTANIYLQPFTLANIDTMRQRLLSYNFLGQEYVINQTSVDGQNELLPYAALVRQDGNSITYNAYTMNGLVVKTYQSDLFNNWLSNTMIDEITQRTTMDTSNGFSMDQLNFMEKSYEVLTRIAITDGSYEDWQEAVYGEGAIRKAETPMYMGGMSAEIMFEEVIASTESGEGGSENYQALGALGGKGTAVNKKGGHNIHIKCEEPCYIIGICSITPRVAYSQGNDWDLTELNSMDDLHKPGFDGIGFQDLMVEQMAWWNTTRNINDGTLQRNSAGKQTAWINYQTAVDKVYGDFAQLEKAGYMVLNRQYYMPFEGDRLVADLTTYIDPAKYNYAFSYTKLDAQNFWVQIHSNVVARRKMAAQQIPNL